MMQNEFENLLGRSVDHEEYTKIETVYMCFEEMSKQEIVDLYKREGEFVTNVLYNYVLDIDKADSRKNSRIYELEKTLECRNNFLGNMTTSYECLQKENKQLKKELDFVKELLLKNFYKGYENKLRIEELEAELHQYKALFAELENNATVSLYKTLLGVTE